MNIFKATVILSLMVGTFIFAQSPEGQALTANALEVMKTQGIMDRGAKLGEAIQNGNNRFSHIFNK